MQFPAELEAAASPRITRRLIVEEARSWIGTPYHHQASCQSAGTDCLGLVRGVYRALIGREAEAAPAYTPDWGEIAGSETLLQAAERHLRRIAPDAARDGDVVIFRMRRGAIAKHAGILSGRNTMVHAVERIGVIEVPVGRWWQRHIAGAFAFPGIED
jgi:NlpC/P60 family putative phage cell wall peptidase